MLVKLSFKGRDAVTDNEDVYRLFYEVIGYVEPKYLQINQIRPGVVSVEVRTPDMFPLLQCTINRLPTSDPGKLSAEITLSTSKDITHWILTRIASSTDNNESSELTSLKKRYLLTAKNLQGLKQKLRLSKICTIVFFTYSTISIITATATFITDDEQARYYGKPLFMFLSIVLFGIFLTFLVSIKDFRKEMLATQKEYEELSGILIATIDPSKETIIEECNQYVTSVKGLTALIIGPKEIQTEHIEPNKCENTKSR